MDGQTGIQTDRWMPFNVRATVQSAVRLVGGQAGRQTDRQTDRRRHDSQHIDTYHKRLICDTQHNKTVIVLSAIMPSVVFYLL